MITRKFWVDLRFLWLEQVLEVRTFWYWYLPFVLALPMAIIFGFARFGSGLTDEFSLIYIISGAAIFSVVNEGLGAIAIRVGSMRKEGMLTYYFSLPISRIAFVLALILSRLVITIPIMLLVLLIGPPLYGLQMQLHPWVLVLLPLTAVAMSAVGLAMGTLITSLELIQVLTSTIISVMMLAAPIFIPMDALPSPLQLVALLFPPTYAAEALRMALNRSFDASFYLNVIALLVMAGLSLFLLTHRLSWSTGHK